MIKNVAAWKRFEDRLIRETPQLSLPESLRLLDAMWDEGRKLGVLPPSDPLEGIDVDIEIARILNCLTSSFPE